MHSLCAENYDEFEWVRDACEIEIDFGFGYWAGLVLGMCLSRGPGRRKNVRVSGFFGDPTHYDFHWRDC